MLFKTTLRCNCIKNKTWYNVMDIFTKRVTKNDKKSKKGLYTQKYIRIKQETLSNKKSKEKDLSINIIKTESKI